MSRPNDEEADNGYMGTLRLDCNAHLTDTPWQAIQLVPCGFVFLRLLPQPSFERG